MHGLQRPRQRARNSNRRGRLRPIVLRRDGGVLPPRAGVALHPDPVCRAARHRSLQDRLMGGSRHDCRGWPRQRWPSRTRAGALGYSLPAAKRPSVRSGLNRFVWDLKYPGPETLDASLAPPRNKPLAEQANPPAGPTVVPGQFRVEMSADSLGKVNAAVNRIRRLKQGLSVLTGGSQCFPVCRANAARWRGEGSGDAGARNAAVCRCHRARARGARSRCASAAPRLIGTTPEARSLDLAHCRTSASHG